jgi:capsular polysaccharide biosynthesis protein
MNSSQRPDIEPADYLGVLRRRWWIIVGLVILGALGAAGYLKVAHKEYTATASVYVQATGAQANQVANGRTSGAVNMDSEAQLVQSNSVATIAAHTLHASSPTALSSHVSVTVPANSQVLQISCTQHTAADAAACAQAFANAYLKNRSASAASQADATLATLRSQAAPLQRDVAKLTSKIAALPSNSPQEATAKAQLNSDQSQLSALNRQIGSIIAEQANSSPGSIITAATPPSKPTSPKKTLILPGGIVIGLLVGLILAFLVDRRDQRVRNAADLERRLDVPVMLAIQSRQRNSQPTLAAPRSRAGQMFSELAYSTAAALGEGNHVLFVAGASQGSGSGVTAASLAAALARTHSDVTLVCADMNGSVIPALFGLGPSRGLAEVLAGKATAWDVAQRPTGYSRLRVITPGMDTSLLLYEFQHDVTHALISELRRTTSMVIIEAQVGTGSGDTFALAEFADTALVVAEAGRTERQEIAATLQRLDRLHTPVLGAVLVPRFVSQPGPAQPRPAVRDEPRAYEPEASAAGARNGAPSARLSPSAEPAGDSALPERDLSETRPLPFSFQSARTESRGGPQPSGAERAEPTGNFGEG